MGHNISALYIEANFYEVPELNRYLGTEEARPFSQKI